MLEQVLRGLEAVGQRLADGLLDDPRTGKADERARLGKDQVPESAFRSTRGIEAYRQSPGRFGRLRLEAVGNAYARIAEQYRSALEG